MKLEADDILNYHCPRFSELPEIELYIDQLVSILQKYLSIFSKDKDVPVITPSMINNYVKQHIVEPPIKKKYNREHIAHFMAICILKKSMSISEIGDSIKIMLKKYSVEDAYDMFCEELEKALRYTFSPKNRKPIETYDETDIREIATLRAMTTAFANSVLVDRLIMLR